MTGGLLLTCPEFGCQPPDVDLVDDARKLPGCGQLAHKGGVSVRLGTAQPVIEMGDTQRYVELSAEGAENIKQAQRVGATGDADNHGVAGSNEVVSLKGISDSG
jgi:hypothetical protein